MTYSSGSIILATDYNNFANGPQGNSIGNIWGVGGGDAGWGQSNIANVSAAATVTATQWATLVNNITSAGQQTGQTLTSRTAPVAGNTISILANVATDITTVTTYRGNAAGSGTTSDSWTGNIAKTSATGSGQASWTITFTSVVTFPSADQARYFWNAGGLVRIDMSKTSTGTDHDADWNDFVATVGTLYMSGRVNFDAQTIAGTSYTGFTRSGGSGTPSPFQSTTGWYSLTGGASATTMFQLNSSTSAYTGEFVRVTAAVDAGRTTLTFVTTWTDDGTSAPGTTSNISGGTDTASPYTTFGTAPAVLVRYVPPSSTYLTNSWGTPTIASSIS
jgi:hypothetical protein